MEIGENAEKSTTSATTTTSTIAHCTSQPTFHLDDDQKDDESGSETMLKTLLKKRRVSFAASTQLAQYLEPINPFQKLTEPISTSEELSSLYRESCEKHKTVPIPLIVEHLEAINLDKSTSSTARTEVLNLRHQQLTHESCEALEELFKNVKYKTIDLTGCSLDDVSATAIFDMIEYYEACNELIVAENFNIKNLGWQSCINMLKRSTSLESFITRGTPLTDSNALALGNALTSLSSHIYTLKLEQCGLSGRPIMNLCGALHKNRTLKELCLANNQLNANDAKSIAHVLKNNFHLQLLDISNNDVQDQGFLHLADALSYQSAYVNQTSSACNSVTSACVKFDFTDLTASLNNINNNRQRPCATPPPMPKIKLDNVTDDGAYSLNNNNNNNSILQCDSDDSKKKKSNDELMPEAATDAMTSTKSDDNTSKDEDGKFKYTTASLSPISQSYDDSASATNSHNLFNAERSFSSESLCSETSIESNDSKSSIRLIENKFNNRNGTLERQTAQVYLTSPFIIDEKQPTGLQVLILWNNNITSKSSSSAFDMFESADFLEIANFGQNPIGDEFLIDTKAAIKGNKSLMSIGLQATGMSNVGLKCIAEIIDNDGNMSLQRIDLRNNEFTAPSLMALFDALRSNRSLIRIDIDDSPKNEAEAEDYTSVVKKIRDKCKFNETPANTSPSSTKVIENITSRVKKANTSCTRKISLTCQSVKAPTSKQALQQQQQQNLEPKTIKPTSPALSPLPSPSRSSRFQVSRVSASESSPSPSSSSGSPTFFPPARRSRFKVVSVAEPKKAPSQPQEVVESPLLSSDSRQVVVDVVASVKPQPSREIDIPLKSSPIIAPQSEPDKTAFLKLSSPSTLLLSSQSCEQLDCSVKAFIDIDSCSSFSSSIESIDHPTDMSSTESFEYIDKSPIIVEPSCISEPLKILEDDDKKEGGGVFSNENTLVSTSSSSSSNEGLTLTTNSPTSELSPKNDAQKRVRKTSLIKSGNYPATLDKLLNLFHHPTSIFTKTSPESTLSSSPTATLMKPKTSSNQLNKEEKGMGQKENSLSGFFTSLVSLGTQKRDEKLAANESQILQNISPENTVGKSSPQMSLEALPKCIKQEMKENISPENTISSENLVEFERQKSSSKVVFLVGDEESLDIPEYTEECSTSDMLGDKRAEKEGESHLSLGDKTKDSMAILREKSIVKEESSSSEMATE